MTVGTLAMSAAPILSTDSAALFYGARQRPGSLKRKFEGTGHRTSTSPADKRGEDATLEAMRAVRGNPSSPPNPSKKASIGVRQNSLRRVKNSTDVLRQRSTKATSRDIVPDGLSGAREGRQFTVANVGNNGLIYLRPVVRPPQQRPSVPSFVFPLTAQAPGATIKTDIKRVTEEKKHDSSWSETQTSQTPTHIWRVNSTGGRTQRSNSTSKRLSTRHRSNSLSTLDRYAIDRSVAPGVFKVVVDRPHPLATTFGRTSFPTLEVPIPHYRLGTPRFSARGTAFLHSSIYTRTSTNDDVRSSVFSGADLDKIFPVPPGMEPRRVPSRRHSHTSPQPYAVRVAPSRAESNDSAPLPPVRSDRMKEPIVPAVFDELAAQNDDVSVVRYSPTTGDIAAASPARIIAQVTSENFLDYELLSDFFLTVRSYLSTQDLLAYLVARFEWAINKFDDDGRVIRVRAFAAFRHWILNYFPYDFVVDRELRVQFCLCLNKLSREVRERSTYGTSDMKLILDLKRCWNGRCALYWDCATFDGDSRDDVDIIPGGVAGSRNSELSHPSQLRSMLIVAPTPRQEGEIRQDRSVSTLDNWFDAVMDAGDTGPRTHKRQISGATVRSLPISPTSEQSIQVLSCSIPAKGLKRTMRTSSHAFGAHPVPITPPNHKIGPAARSAIYNESKARPKHTHKRSGSFSDALRDHRAPLASSKGEQSADSRLLTVFPYAGSMIRGNAFPPGQPYVEIPAPITPSVELPNIFFASEDSDSIYADTTTKSHGLHAPGVRNILGSIRRALSSKQSGSHHSSNAGVKGPSPPLNASRKVLGLPPHQRCYCGDEPEHKSYQNKGRADLLAADVAESFQRACSGDSAEDLQRLRGAGLSPGTERGEHPSDAQPIPDSRSANSRREQSAVTLGSQSIPIVDDTGSDRPPMPSISRDYVTADMTDAVEPSLYGVAPSLTLDTLAAMLSRVGQAEVQYEERQPRNNSIPSVSSGHIVDLPRSDPTGPLSDGDEASAAEPSAHQPGPSAISQGRSFGSTRSASTSLRRYASFHGGMAKYVPDYSFSAATASDTAARSSDAVSDSPPARMLRRRPGGDLRANQNVHELEQIPRPRSAGSITTYADSVIGSGLYVAKRGTARDVLTFGSSKIFRSIPPEPGVVNSLKSPSLVRTHSSQPALRPSFEAAVAEFARIPDDEEGGIEATLLKLEGKYEKIPIESHVASPGESTDMEGISRLKREFQEHGSDQLPHHYNPVVDSTVSKVPETSRERLISISNFPKKAGVSAPSRSNSQYLSRMTPSLYAESDESYNSVPLLERGLSGRSTRRGRIEQNGYKGFVPQRLIVSNRNSVSDAPEFSKLSIEQDSVMRFRHGSSVPTATTDSFLLDEDEDLSDLSSEMSGEDVELEHTVYQDPASSMYNFSGLLVPTTEMTHRPSQYPPSPPMTTENALEIKAQAHQTQEDRRPPTPDPSPITQTVEPILDSVPVAYNQTTTLPSITGYASISFPRTSQHMCFILAYASETLAEQFTLIEKDALNEIDWRDLVDMRWHHKSLQILNWVEYLRTQDPTGIDLVTARFNIVVKWALSEIVMTQNIEERALTIVKYIHVAQQCRRIHNYATLMQLTIALSSIDCSRLTKTWARIPAAEKKILQDLETLVTPMRNFHNLRKEMETANAEEGCIPVVAFYIHDLTHNAQKPAQIPNTRGGEPLINFERHRTTASIVKSLLRLIDASAKYTYQPARGLVDRCLWMATLTDEAIRSRSKELE